MFQFIFSKLLFKFLYQIKVDGLENIPDQSFILTPNHQSFYDGFILMAVLKRQQRRRIYAYATKQYFPGKILRLLAERHQIILIDTDLKLSMKKSASLLQHDKSLMIFPEGARTLSGKMQEFKPTFAILSRELNVPVVPVSIEGAYEVWPPGQFFPKIFKKMRVRFFPAVKPGKLSYDDIKEKTEQQIKEDLAS